MEKIFICCVLIAIVIVIINLIRASDACYETPDRVWIVFTSAILVVLIVGIVTMSKDREELVKMMNEHGLYEIEVKEQVEVVTRTKKVWAKAQGEAATDTLPVSAGE